MSVTCLPVPVNSLTYFHLRTKRAYVPHPQTADTLTSMFLKPKWWHQQVILHAWRWYRKTESGLTQLVPPKRTPGWD